MKTRTTAKMPLSLVYNFKICKFEAEQALTAVTWPYFVLQNLSV